MNIEDVDLRRIKSTLVIMYCGRSGSYLLSNLLDGHSETLSCPPHSVDKLIENIVLMIGDAKKHALPITPDYLIHKIVNNHPFLFKETDHTILTEDFEEELRLATDNNADLKETGSAKGSKITATSNSEIGVDKVKFCYLAKSLMKFHLERYAEALTVSDIFSLVHWSYALALGHKISTKNPTICWQRHVHIPPNWVDLMATSVTNPVFVTIVRQFEDALDSHLEVMAPEFENKEDNWRVLTSQFAYNLGKKDIDIPQWAIRFEDMHINTEPLMRHLCQRLGVNFEPILLETTLDNQIYFFDKDGEPKTGTNKNLKRSAKFDNLSVPDIIFLNLLFCKHYEFYDYEFHPALLDFVECDPTSLSGQDLTDFLTGIQQSGKSYLGNVLIETDFQSVAQIAQQEFKPLELINAV